MKYISNCSWIHKESKLDILSTNSVWALLLYKGLAACLSRTACGSVKVTVSGQSCWAEPASDQHFSPLLFSHCWMYPTCTGSLQWMHCNWCSCQRARCPANTLLLTHATRHEASLLFCWKTVFLKLVRGAEWGCRDGVLLMPRFGNVCSCFLTGNHKVELSSCCVFPRQPDDGIGAYTES